MGKASYSPDEEGVSDTARELVDPSSLRRSNVCMYDYFWNPIFGDYPF